MAIFFDWSRRNKEMIFVNEKYKHIDEDIRNKIVTLRCIDELPGNPLILYYPSEISEIIKPTRGEEHSKLKEEVLTMLRERGQTLNTDINPLLCLINGSEEQMREEFILDHY